MRSKTFKFMYPIVCETALTQAYTVATVRAFSLPTIAPERVRMV